MNLIFYLIILHYDLLVFNNFLNVNIDNFLKEMS